MKFTPALQSGRLIKRYKRFLADVTLEDGRCVTLHCPNTGSMKNCQYPDHKIWFSTSDNPKRKYSRTWELMQTPEDHLIGINSGRANALAEEAINNGVIAELSGYSHLKREVKYGHESSRIDILLQDEARADCYIEVKSCTLLEEGQGYFPDAVSARGQKHLRELINMAAEGHRSVLLFVVQHTGISSVKAAAHIDPDYAQILAQAKAAGVEILAYRASLTPEAITLCQPCPVLI